MKSKYFLTISAVLATLFFTGCSPSIKNLTSERIPQNASGIYTLSMAVQSDNGSIVDNSYKPEIVIAGQREPMQRSELGPNTYEFDFALPEGITEAKYYYILNYDVDYNGNASPRQITSDLYQFQLTNRYVITMESQRGPVGASIAVVGRGFTEFDQIIIGGMDAETIYASPQSLNFIVPALPAGEAYPVELVSGFGSLPIGYFQVDGSRMKVYPEQIDIESGERTVLIFGIDSVAPEGGLPISISTDRPESIIMPEVVIPAGAQTVSVPIQGGVGGSGIVLATAPGFKDLEIPLQVSGNVLNSAQAGRFNNPTLNAVNDTPVGTVEYSESGEIITQRIPPPPIPGSPEAEAMSGVSTIMVAPQAPEGGDLLLIEETDIIEVSE